MLWGCGRVLPADGRILPGCGPPHGIARACHRFRLNAMQASPQATALRAALKYGMRWNRYERLSVPNTGSTARRINESS